MNAPKQEILDPTGPEGDHHQVVIPPPTAIDGRVVGVIDNSKPNFDRFVQGLRDRLTDLRAIRGFEVARKESPAVGVEPTHLAGLAAECAVVLTGSGD